MTFDTIVGQDRALRVLRRMLENRRVPHALLFTGIEGVGRQTAARALAMVLACRSPEGATACRQCPSCRKMVSGNHPDLLTVDPEGAYIKIDQVRTLRKRLALAPVEGGRRVVIVNDAHRMNREASNALLKTLEEPPKGTHIVLTAPDPMDLLPTIVSRCQHVPFKPLSERQIGEMLQARKGLDGDSAAAVAILAKGSLGRALDADTDAWMAWRRDLLERLRSLSKGTIPPLFAFSEALSRDKDRLEEALDLFLIWFRDLLIWKFRPEGILNRDLAVQIEQEAASLSVRDLVKKVSAVEDTRRRLSRNANRRLAVDVLLMQLGSVCSRSGAG